MNRTLSSYVINIDDVLMRHLYQIIICVLFISCVACVATPIPTPQFDVLIDYKEIEKKLGDSRFVKTNEVYFLSTAGSSLSIKNLVDDNFHDIGISANWLDAQSDEHGDIIFTTTSLGDMRVRIYRINSVSMSSEILSSIGDTTILKIDPSIERYNDNWFLIFTTVIGTVNNADPSAKGGLYTVNLYRSSDLENWERMDPIVSGNYNIEDGRLLYSESSGSLLYFFEQEEFEQGPSSLRILQSADFGNTWGDEQIVVDDGADNEPSCFTQIDDLAFYVFYSSDINNPGQSYEGGNAYARSSYDLNVWSEAMPVSLGDHILLVDALVSGESVFYSVLQNLSSTPIALIYEGRLIEKDVSPER